MHNFIQYLSLKALKKPNPQQILNEEQQEAETSHGENLWTCQCRQNRKKEKKK